MATEEDEASTEARMKRTIYVGALDSKVTKAIVHATTIPFGEIRGVEMPLDFKTGTHRGFAFVEFEEEADALEAIFNLHDSELFGRVITVNLAREPQNARTGRASRPVWADDLFFRKRLKEQASRPGRRE